MLKRIIENDMYSCHEVLTADKRLSELDALFYMLVDSMQEKERLETEEVFSEYMARVIRIAYLQGLKDFAELHLEIKQDIQNILEALLERREHYE